MPKKKKVLRSLSPAFPGLISIVGFVGVCIVNPDAAEATQHLPDEVAVCAIMFGFMLGVISWTLGEYVSLFFDHKDKKVTVTVRIDESAYAELKALGERNNVVSVSDVIPGVLEYVLDGVRDQEG